MLWIKLGLSGEQFQPTNKVKNKNASKIHSIKPLTSPSFWREILTRRILSRRYIKTKTVLSVRWCFSTVWIAYSYCAFEWNLISRECVVKRLNNRRSVCKQNPPSWWVNIREKLTSQRIREPGFHHHSSLSLRGGKKKHFSCF
jgi:hypothetical protein